MRPPDGVGRCRACPLQAALWEGLCLRCALRCRHCAGSGVVRIAYHHPRNGFGTRTVARRCQSCAGSGRNGLAV